MISLKQKLKQNALRGNKSMTSVLYNADDVCYSTTSRFNVIFIIEEQRINTISLEDSVLLITIIFTLTFVQIRECRETSQT